MGRGAEVGHVDAPLAGSADDGRVVHSCRVRLERVATAHEVAIAVRRRRSATPAGSTCRSRRRGEGIGADLPGVHGGPRRRADRSAVCGACRSGLSSIGDRAGGDSRRSPARIASIAVAEPVELVLSSSLSVGSTIKVPATGKLIVGAWKPKSISRLATSSTVTPVAFVIGRRSRMHSWATRPARRVEHRERAVEATAT